MSAVIYSYLIGYKVISFLFYVIYSFLPQSMPPQTHSETHIKIESELIVYLMINYGAVLRKK